MVNLIKEIRIHGRGGQGNVTASEFLAEAAFADGLFAQAFPMFGSERHGAPVTAYVRISDRPIRLRSQVYEPDYVIVQDASLFQGNGLLDGLKDGGLVVINTSLPQSEFNIPGNYRVVTVPATEPALGREGEAKIIAQAGDGGTADIGMGALSGMLERGHDMLCVCYDTEVYSNTGYQRPGLTPVNALTTTSPTGRLSWGNATRKKDLPAVVAAHGAVYVAISSAGYPVDIQRKIKKALTFTGPKYVQIHSPCVSGWGVESHLTVRSARAAVNSGLYPLFEMEGGEITRVRKIKKEELVPVESYLRPQKRFAHLFKYSGGDEHIKEIQAVADENIRKYGLLS